MDLKEYFRNRDMVGKQEDELTEEQKNLACITIDGNVIGGYGSYSFVRVVEYVSEPQRSSDGKISNLDGYTTFITPKVKLHFNAISIDGYKLLMNLITSKREFYVGCYDFVSGKWVHQNMYFYPNDYPEIFQYDLQVLAVLNFDIELIGTNTNNENIVITLNSNYPTSRGQAGDSRVNIHGNAVTGDANYNIADAYQNEYAYISYPNNFVYDKKLIVDTVEHRFSHWNTKADGTGLSTNDGGEIALPADTTLYAIWESGRHFINFIYARDEQPQVYYDYYENGKPFATGKLPVVSWTTIEDGKRYKYTVDHWYKENNFDNNGAAEGNQEIIGLYPHELVNYCAYGQATKRLLGNA